MNTTIKACLFGGAVFAAGIAHAGDTYRIYGPGTCDSYAGGYAIDNASTADLVAALTNPYIFSHYASLFDASVNVTAWCTLDSNEQAYGDCLISTWWYDNNATLAELQAARAHFLDGGDLILFSDSNYTDAIADYLGLPVQNYASDGNLNGSGFPFDGPFGTVTGATAGGSIGYLRAADVAATDGQVLAVNNAGQILVAFWDDNQYAPGAGRMIIVTDINTVAGGFGAWDYNDLNNPNTRFALNLFAGMIGSDPCNGADTNADGQLNFDDIDAFVDNFLGGCS